MASTYGSVTGIQIFIKVNKSLVFFHYLYHNYAKYL